MPFSHVWHALFCTQVLLLIRLITSFETVLTIHAHILLFELLELLLVVLHLIILKALVALLIVVIFVAISTIFVALVIFSQSNFKYGRLREILLSLALSPCLAFAQIFSSRFLIKYAPLVLL